MLAISRATFTEISPPQKPAEKLLQVVFSWSGQELILSTGDGQVKILDYPSFSTLHTVHAHTAPCPGLDISPAGTSIAVGGEDAIISLWDTTEFICQRTFAQMEGPVKSLSFSFDGHYLVGGSDDGLNLDIAHVDSGEYQHKVITNRPAPLVSWHPSRYVLAYVEEGRGLNILGASWVS